MKNKKKLMTNADILKLVYKLNDNISLVKQGALLTIHIPYDRPLQKFFRKIKFKIPLEKKVELDEKSSFVISQIDGQKTLQDIAALIENKYGSETDLINNLLLFINHIEVNEHYIEQVKL